MSRIGQPVVLVKAVRRDIFVRQDSEHSRVTACSGLVHRVRYTLSQTYLPMQKTNTEQPTSPALLLTIVAT
jgi:hypothetical protein